MSACSFTRWTGLPSELQLAILENLSLADVWSCSRASRETYSVCLPILFKTVKLPSIEDLNNFLEAVPSERFGLIRDLFVSTRSKDDNHYHHDAFTRPTFTDSTGILIALLSHCTSLESLTLHVSGALNPTTILPVFKNTERIKKLSLEKLYQEEFEPLSERLAVSIAFSLPRLEELSLTCITRSAIHAPELLYSNVPLVRGDDSIPPHPMLGNELRLPQLFRLPHLKRLRIRETHLGDPLWASIPIESEGSESCCPLELLDLGSCSYISPAANELHAARILTRVPSSITSCALSSSLPPPASSTFEVPPSPIKGLDGYVNSASPLKASSTIDTFIPPLPRLRTLHLTPLVPTSLIGSTLSQPALAASPVQNLSCAFFPNDAAEGCAALESFLRERARVNSPSTAAAAAVQLPFGRKRAFSQLRLCTEPEALTSGISSSGVSGSSGSGSSSSGINDIPAPIIVDQTIRNRTRANTASASYNPQSILTTSSSSSSTSSTPFSELATTRLYSSLRTLTIEIPHDVMSTSSTTTSTTTATTSSSPGARLSPRRLAAARRREEERREAARKLRTCAQELGVDLVLRGIDIGGGGASGGAGACTQAVNASGSGSASIGTIARSSTL